MKISKFKLITITRLADKIAYLLLLAQPTIKSKKENNRDKIPIKSKLYSISQKAKFTPHTKFTQKR